MIYNTKYATKPKGSKEQPVKSFEGTYTRVGAKLTHNSLPGIQFIIGTREKPTRNKAKHFLLSFEGRNKPNLYFSSLYPTIDPNRFEAEYGGVRYVIILDSDKAEVSVLNQSQQAA